MSPVLSWSSTLDLGIPSVDQQHRALADLLNRLTDCTQDASAALVLLDELYAHTRDHFLHEEVLMEEIGYAEHHSHHTEHVLLLAELKHFIAQIRDGKIQLEPHSLSALKGWLVSHIKDSDRTFAKSYLHTKRARME